MHRVVVPAVWSNRLPTTKTSALVSPLRTPVISWKGSSEAILTTPQFQQVVELTRNLLVKIVHWLESTVVQLPSQEANQEVSTQQETVTLATKSFQVAVLTTKCSLTLSKGYNNKLTKPHLAWRTLMRHLATKPFQSQVWNTNQTKTTYWHRQSSRTRSSYINRKYSLNEIRPIVELYLAHWGD